MNTADRTEQMLLEVLQLGIHYGELNEQRKNWPGFVPYTKEVVLASFWKKPE